MRKDESLDNILKLDDCGDVWLSFYTTVLKNLINTLLYTFKINISSHILTKEYSATID